VTFCGEQVWSLSTRRSRRMSYQSFYAWAKRSKRVKRSPAKNLPRVRATKPEPRPLPEPMYDAAMLRADDRVRLILRMAHDAGMRRAEIAVAHSSDLEQDLVGWSLRVHGKGGKTRTVPLTPRLAFDLLALGAGYFFAGDIDGHLSPRRVGELATDALPGEWTLHTLRHSFASRAYGVNQDVFAVQDLLGHASAETTRGYVFVPKDNLRSTVYAMVDHHPLTSNVTRISRAG
jgi:integrase/recombinase XerC